MLHDDMEADAAQDDCDGDNMDAGNPGGGNIGGKYIYRSAVVIARMYHILHNADCDVDK